MKLALITLTCRGKKLAEAIREGVGGESTTILTRSDWKGEKEESGGLSGLVGELFSDYDGLVFVMSLGIVVRLIAPHLEDKRRDPAVVTIDETGHYVVSTLSGHIGGANQLARAIADVIGGEAVLTTATDRLGLPAPDLLAEKLNCAPVPSEGLKAAAAAMVRGKRVNFFLESFFDCREELLELDSDQLFPLSALGMVEGFPVIITKKNVDVKKEHLQLVPRRVVAGVGCRRGREGRVIEDALMHALARAGLRAESLKALATVDMKGKEPGIINCAKHLGIPLLTVSREEIRTSSAVIHPSEFVRKAIGVGGVCEPAALLRAERGKLLLAKTAGNGVTVALAE